MEHIALLTAQWYQSFLSVSALPTIDAMSDHIGAALPPNVPLPMGGTTSGLSAERGRACTSHGSPSVQKAEGWSPSKDTGRIRNGPAEPYRRTLQLVAPPVGVGKTMQCPSKNGSEIGVSTCDSLSNNPAHTHPLAAT